MQTMRSILHISSRGTELTDEYGSTTGVALEVVLGAAVKLELELRGDAGSENAALANWPLSSCTAAEYYFALDTATANSSSPKLLRISGITFAADANGRTICSITLPNTAVTGVVTALGDEEDMAFWAELGGMDDNGVTVFAWQFKLTIRSRVYLGGGTESVAGDPDYYTAAQVESVLGRTLVYEYSIDGSTAWHSGCVSADRFFRLRHGSNGTPSAAQPIPFGPAGAQGAKGDKGDKGDPGESGASTAANVSIADAGGHYLGTTAEAALQELREGQAITALAAVSGAVTVPAGEGVVYTHTLAASETITPTAPASGYCATAELWLTQPSTAVSFTWGTTILWDDGSGHFASGSTAPDFTTANRLYCVVLRYDGSNWLGNIAYTKEVTA